LNEKKIHRQVKCHVLERIKITDFFLKEGKNLKTEKKIFNGQGDQVRKIQENSKKKFFVKLEKNIFYFC